MSTEIDYSQYPNAQNDRIMAMSIQSRYYDSVKFMVHMVDDREKRKKILEKIAYANPYLCAHSIMTICEDTTWEENFLYHNIKHRIPKIQNRVKRVSVAMALLELGRYEKFTEYFAQNRDLFNQSTTFYFLSHFGSNKVLHFIEAMIQTGIYSPYYWTVEYLSKEFDPEDSEFAYQLAKQIFEAGYYARSYRLLRFTVGTKNIAVNMGVSAQDLVERMCREAKSLDSTQLQYAVALIYDFQIDAPSDIETWNQILKYPLPASREQYSKLVRRSYENGVIPATILERYLREQGVEISGRLDETADKYFASFMPENVMKKEPFYSLYSDEQAMLTLLADKSFENPCAFSLMQRIKEQPEDDTEQENLSFFLKCAANYQSAENLVHVFFNTPWKNIIYIEDLLGVLKNQFHLDDHGIRYVLGDYAFFGKVCNVNPISISIRSRSFHTKEPCRMNTKKFWIPEGEGRHSFRVGEILYFKYNYYAEDSDKINVHYPALSFEEMKVLEERRIQKQKNKELDAGV